MPTLLDGRGAFLGKQEFRDAVAAGEVSVQCVATEAAAQWAAFLTLSGGVPPTHVDGHQHIQTLPLIAGVIVAQFAALRCVRLPTLHPAEEGGVARMPPLRAQFYHTVSSEAGGVAPVFAAAGLRSPAFLGYTCMGDDATVAGVANMLAEASAGGEGEGAPWVELMVHPGLRVPPSTGEGEAGCGRGPDAFSMAAGREHEMAVLRELRATHPAWGRLRSFVDLGRAAPLGGV